MLGPGLGLIGQEEVDSVMEVLTSRELSRYRFGAEAEVTLPKVVAFERALAQTLGVQHCLGLNSCTSALLAGLSALGIGPGHEVIVPGYTFIASIAAIAYARAVPVLAEIDESLTLDPADVESRITPRTKAILVVHMQGAPANMDALLDIARRHKLAVIEDVAQACGGSYRGRRLGSMGDVGAFSFNVFKVITAGDGGALATNRKDLYERAFAFHDHGSKPLRLGLADEGSILGLNLRMHELTGAMAVAQVHKLERILKELRDRKHWFQQVLSRVPGLRFRVIHDEAGDCATTLTLIFETTELATRVATAIGSKTLLQSGRHYYGNMIQLLGKRMPTAGCPFTCPSHPTPVEFSKGMLPRTDSVLSRAVSLSIGVNDSYLGTDFGVNILTNRSGVEAKAEEFIRRTSGILG